MKRIPDQDGTYLQQLTDTNTGEIIDAPCEIFEITHLGFYIEVIGHDFKGKFTHFSGEKPGTRTEYISKLDSLPEKHLSIKEDLIKSLQCAGWNFEQYPNPEIISIHMVHSHN